MKRFKSVVFIVRQTWDLTYFPFATSSKCRSLFSTRFPRRLLLQQTTPWLNLHFRHVKTCVIPSTDWYLPPFSRSIKRTWCWSASVIPVLEETAETMGRAVNAVSTCRNTFNFFYYLVIFGHYFTGDGKVSCILATISNWFPNIKIWKQKLCRGFL